MGKRYNKVKIITIKKTKRRHKPKGLKHRKKMSPKSSLRVRHGKNNK